MMPLETLILQAISGFYNFFLKQEFLEMRAVFVNIISEFSENMALFGGTDGKYGFFVSMICSFFKVVDRCVSLHINALRHTHF